MASKKQMLMVGLISLFSSAGFAQQNDAGFDWRDSSKISTKNMPQFNEFKNNQYSYPAKQRDMWEIGASAGYSFIQGDVSSRPGFGGGITLRKSLNHLFSARLAYNGSFNYGMDYRAGIPNQLPANIVNDPYQRAYGAGNRFYVPAYRTAIHQGSIEVVLNLNNLSYYRGNPKTNWYVFGGYTFISADVDVDALNASNQPYNWQSFNFARSRSAVRNDLKNIINLDYESNAGVLNGNRNNIGRNNGNQLLRHGMTAGAGIAYKLNNRWNVALEQRFSMSTYEDGFDGGMYRGKNDDIISYTSAKINYNIGNASKRVQPLSWINPNNYIYQELNKPTHPLFPPVILPDADGDGITDQFDLEPNTPKGAPVDSRGVARDSDGDGVPDYKDKELLTPQSCFPVNADGVGTCPESKCCIENRKEIEKLKDCCNKTCPISSLPTIEFKSGSSVLTSNAKALLDGAAQQLKDNPSCKVNIVGYCKAFMAGKCTKAEQLLSQNRAKAVANYLETTRGIAGNRIMISDKQPSTGASNTVDLMPVGQ